MKDRIIKITPVFLLLAIFSSTLLSAQETSLKPNKEANFHSKIIEELGLSQDQMQALKAFRQKKMQVRELMQSVKSQHEEMRSAIQSGEGESEINAKVERLNQGMAELNRIRVRNMLEVRNALGTEKFGRLLQFVKSHKRGIKRKLAQKKGKMSNRGVDMRNRGSLGAGKAIRERKNL